MDDQIYCNYCHFLVKGKYVEYITGGDYFVYHESCFKLVVRPSFAAQLTVKNVS